MKKSPDVRVNASQRDGVLNLRVSLDTQERIDLCREDIQRRLIQARAIGASVDELVQRLGECDQAEAKLKKIGG